MREKLITRVLKTLCCTKVFWNRKSNYFLLQLLMKVFFSRNRKTTDNNVVPAKNVSSTVASKVKKTVSDLCLEATDHLPGDTFLKKLTAKQRQLIEDTYNELIKIEGIQEQAALTHWELSRHLIYRYYSSVDWADKYYGKR